MDQRPLGKTGINCSRLGWGAFKIGRNTGTKFPSSYELPSEEEAVELIHGMIDLGINLIDTAPSYGLSEERLGMAVKDRRDEVLLSTKIGEQFEDGESHHDFTSSAAVKSLQESLRRLQTDHVDLLLVHSDGRDQEILADEEYIETLLSMKEAGLTRAIGFSGKTPDGSRSAMDWADVLMIEYHPEDRSHEEVIAEAGRKQVGVLIKKALRSGHLSPDEALRFLYHDSPVADHITSLVIGSLSLKRMRANADLLT
ncbi:MAG: aldo/keto reductase [Phycisphaerales bacterium]|nr:aldo/keto reductase [Phycisphaerales bacterium]